MAESAASANAAETSGETTMEDPKNDPNIRQSMKDGTATKAIYIKHLSLEDWDTLGQIQSALGGKSVADAIRWAIRRAGGKV